MIYSMATMTIRATFSIDNRTRQNLLRLAKTWNVSQSEALRRAIDKAADTLPEINHKALAALQKIRERGHKFDPSELENWPRL